MLYEGLHSFAGIVIKISLKISCKLVWKFIATEGFKIRFGGFSDFQLTLGYSLTLVFSP